MNVDSLKVICFNYFSKNSEQVSSQISSIPDDLRFELFEFTTAFFRNKNKILKEPLITNFKISSFTEIDLRQCTITSIVLNQLGRNLTKLSLPYCDENKNQKILDIISSNQDLQIIELQNQPLPKNFIKYCEKLKNLRILKLKGCLGVKYWELLDLFSSGRSSIMELALPPLDINDELFPLLLKRCGKQLRYLSIEHAEKGSEMIRSFRTIKLTKISYPNSCEVINLKHLYAIDKHCPNLEAISFVNIHFHTKCWLGTNSKIKYENIWKNILGSLGQINRIKFKDRKLHGYENMLSFLETMNLQRCKRLIIEKISLEDSTIASIKKNNPHLILELKNVQTRGTNTEI